MYYISIYMSLYRSVYMYMCMKIYKVVLFCGHFEFILDSFWIILMPLEIIGPPRSPKTLSEPILGPFWRSFGSPWGTLRRAFSTLGCPEGSRSERNDASESVWSRARFVIGFSLLFGVPWTPENTNSDWEGYAKQHFQPRPKQTRFGIVFEMV